MTLEAIVDLIYEAALDPDLWGAASKQVAEATGGFAGALMLWDTAGGRAPAIHQQGYPDAMWQAYGSHYIKEDPRSLVFLKNPDIEMYTDAGLGCDARLKRGSGFFDWLDNQCDQRFGYGARLFSGNGYESMLILGRSRAQGEAPTADMDRLQPFLPHLRRAITLAHKLGQRVSTAALDALSFGIAILDEQGRVSFANQRIRAMAAEQDGLSLNGNGLSLADRAENAAHQRSVGQLRRRIFFNGAAPARTALLASRPSGKRPYSILACPFARAPSMLPQANQSVLVCVSDPAQADHLNEALLAALFGLTAAEARLAISLVQRGSLSAAAADCGLTDGSARQYLKRIYGKTGTQGQVDLVALILGSVRS